jgi:hypothetical protein
MDACQSFLNRRKRIDSVDNEMFLPLMNIVKVDGNLVCSPCVVENENGLVGLYTGEEFHYLVIACKDHEDEENNTMNVFKQFTKDIPFPVMKKQMNTLLRFSGMAGQCLA